MVNRVLLVVLSAVVLTSVAVGGLIGSQFGGDDAPGDSIPDVTPEPTATPDATPEPTATPTPEPTATPTPTPKPFDSASVNATAVEAHVLAIVNDHVRDRAGRGPLSREARLDEMARFHSDNMARQGYPAHDAAGYSTTERYEMFDQYTRCRIPSDGNAGVRKGEEIELVGRYTLDRTDVPAEREIADQVVAEWRGVSDEERKLLYENAELVGIGVNVTGDARVYVTVDLC